MLASAATRETREGACGGALHLRSGFKQCASRWPVPGSTLCHNLEVIAVGRLVVADDGKPTPGQIGFVRWWELARTVRDFISWCTLLCPYSCTHAHPFIHICLYPSVRPYIRQIHPSSAHAWIHPSFHFSIRLSQHKAIQQSTHPIADPYIQSIDTVREQATGPGNGSEKRLKGIHIGVAAPIL